MKSIKDWPLLERPREKLLNVGSASLSDAELLAILLRNGSQGKDGLQLARELIDQYGSLREILNSSIPKLMKFKGLGPSKISTLLATYEVSKRILKEKIIGRDYFKSCEQVLDYLSLSLRDQKVELFKVIFLDKGNLLLQESTLFVGTIDEAVIHPREIIKQAFELNAAGLILVHNHPSGRVQPSREDYAITRKLQSICDGLSLKILDHIIIGDNQSFSFLKEGVL